MTARQASRASSSRRPYNQSTYMPADKGAGGMRLTVPDAERLVGSYRATVRGEIQAADPLPTSYPL